MNTQTFNPKEAVRQHYAIVGACLAKLKEAKRNVTLYSETMSLNLREVARLRKKYPKELSRTRTRQTRLKI